MYYLCHVFWQNGQIGKVFAWEIDIMNKKLIPVIELSSEEH